MKHDSFADSIASAMRQIREELIDRGWFSRTAGAADQLGRGFDAGKNANVTIIDARQNNQSIMDASNRSVSIGTGWDFPKEPTRERDGPSHDHDR